MKSTSKNRLLGFSAGFFALLFLGVVGTAQANSLGVIPVQPPKAAKSFSLKDPAGKVVRFEDLKGKVVLLNFWASWCGPCVEEIPSLSKMSEHYKGKDFMIVGISVDSREQDMVKAAERFKIPFKILWDPNGDVGGAYGARVLPTSYFINRQGMVVGMVRGPRPWDSPAAYSYIDSLLGQTDVQKTSVETPLAPAAALDGNLKLQAKGPDAPVAAGKAFVVRLQVAWKGAIDAYDVEPPEQDLPAGFDFVSLGSTTHSEGDVQVIDYDLYLMPNDKAVRGPQKIGPFVSMVGSAAGPVTVQADAVTVNVEGRGRRLIKPIVGGGVATGVLLTLGYFLKRRT